MRELEIQQRGLALDTLYELATPLAVSVVRAVVEKLHFAQPHIWRYVKSIHKRAMLRHERNAAVLEAVQYLFVSPYIPCSTRLRRYAAPSFPPGQPLLTAVLDLLPALQRPTISALSDEQWVAVNTIIEERTVRDLIPRLKSARAQGIVEYPLNKIVL